MHEKDHELRVNGSGCADPTAYEAIKNVDVNEERIRKLIGCIFRICEIAGFRVEERIVLRDVETGKIWR